MYAEKIWNHTTDTHTIRKTEKITVGIVLKDLLVDNLFELMIICRPDDSWWCILHSEEKKKNISFVSGPKTIYDDVRRLIDES